jgi:hypothetical protein
VTLDGIRMGSPFTRTDKYWAAPTFTARLPEALYVALMPGWTASVHRKSPDPMALSTPTQQGLSEVANVRTYVPDGAGNVASFPDVEVGLITAGLAVVDGAAVEGGTLVLDVP